MHRMMSGLRNRAWVGLFVLLLAALESAPCAGQGLGTAVPLGADTTGVASQGGRASPHVVHWWEIAAVAGGVGLVMADDRNVSHELEEHPTKEADDIASLFRHPGDAKVYTALALGTLGTGLLTKDRGITRMAAQLAASGALAAASFGLLKVITGRSRPDVGDGTYEFHPFSGGGSFPSGHSAMAFALATTLGDASHSPWVTAGLYTIAAGTAWSRVYDGRHWPSDVVLGAALGVTSAKLVNGRWRIFGFRSPGFLVTSRGPGMQVSF